MLRNKSRLAHALMFEFNGKNTKKQYTKLISLIFFNILLKF